MTVIKMAPLIDIRDIPEVIKADLLSLDMPLVDALLHITRSSYPEFYVWLVSIGAFKEGEEGWVGII